MASIVKYQLANGETRWRVRYRKPDGRSTDRSGFRLRRSAEDFAATTHVAIESGSFITREASRTTVAALLPLWESRQSQLAHRTRATNLSSWRKHVEPYWGGWPVGRITAPDVRDWVGQLQRQGLGNGVVVRALHVLRSVLDVGVEARRLAANPAQSVRVRREAPARRPYLTAPQVECLVESLEPQWRGLVSVLAYCGPRISEATALQVRDFDPQRRRLSVTKAVKGPGEVGPTKTFEQRSVPVPRFVVERLELARPPGAPLFQTATGSRVDVGNFRVRVFRPAVERAQQWWAHTHPTEFPTVTPGELRHTCASLAISVGSNVLAVSRLLGHENPQVTLRTYAGLFPDDLDGVADAFDQLRG